MKYLIIIMMLLLTGCFTLRKDVSSTRYKCVRNLVEIKVPANEAINFCSKNFQGELGE